MHVRRIAVAIFAIIAGAPSARALTPEEIVNYRGADRQQVLVDGARKEGQVVLYSALIVNQMLRPLAAGFMKKYPFVKMTYLRADSEELLPRISAEKSGTGPDEIVCGSVRAAGMGEGSWPLHRPPLPCQRSLVWCRPCWHPPGHVGRLEGSRAL